MPVVNRVLRVKLHIRALFAVIFQRHGAGERVGDPRQVPESRNAAGKAAAEAGLEERLNAERRACAEPNGCSGSP